MAGKQFAMSANSIFPRFTFIANTVLEKKLKEVEGDFFAPTDFGAAFLGPNLWDKTYGDDDFNFKLEYMELDEFLSENGLPMGSADTVLTNEQREEDNSQNDSDDRASVTSRTSQSDSITAGKSFTKTCFIFQNLLQTNKHQGLLKVSEYVDSFPQNGRPSENLWHCK